MPAFDARSFDGVAFDVEWADLPLLIGSVGDILRTYGRPDARYGVLIESLQINDVADEVPNRATFTARGFQPSVGDRVVFALGSITNPDRLFAGSILRVDNGYVTDDPRNQTYAATCIDDTVRLDRRKVIGHYTGSATAIVLALMAAYGGPGFTTTHVEAGLPTVDGGITFTNQALTDCLTQVAKRIGAYWKLDYFGDLHFFLTPSAGSPQPLTNDHPTLRNVSITKDVSQVVTRVFVEGGGGTALAEIPIAETILPVSEASWYTPTGGQVVSGPQRIRYTGLDLGGGGSLVGTGRAPDAAPNVEAADGAGIESGVHSWAYTYVTATGESIPSPLATLTLGSVAPPTSPPVPFSPTAGAGVTAGLHYYAVSFVTAVGETTVSPLSPSVTTGPVTSGLIDAPVAAPTLTLTGGASSGTHVKTVKYAVTFTNAAGETTAGPQGTIAVTGFDGPSPQSGNFINPGTGSIPAGNYAWYMTAVTAQGESTVGGPITIGIGTSFDFVLTFQSPASTSAFLLAYRFYRTTNAGSTPLYLGQTSSTSDTSYLDTKTDAALGGTAPSVNPTYRSVAVGSIALGPPGTTGRKVYATAPGSSQLRLLTTLANNTATTTTDSNPVNVARLGANVPTANTTATTTDYSQVPLTIPVGPANCLFVYLYRTEAGGSQLKHCATITNGVTTHTDTLADGSLGGNNAVTNSAFANRASLTGIGVGPAGTTARNLYRTVAAGAQLKLVTTIAGNVATTYLDATADAALTTNAPTADSSGLTQPQGQVLAGATTIPVANTIDFPAAGWAIVSGDQLIRYTGKTIQTLTGVTGIGATIGFNSTIVAAPQLTGIISAPAAIQYTIPKGQDVNLLVQIDDVGAQAAIGALLVNKNGAATNGIHEAYIQDRRLSPAEAVARGQAYLDLYSDVETTIRYRCQDPLSKAGVDVTAALTDPMPITGVFKIQTVTISFTLAEAQMFPWYDVVASSTRFSFEDLLRQQRPAQTR